VRQTEGSRAADAPKVGRVSILGPMMSPDRRKSGHYRQPNSLPPAASANTKLISTELKISIGV